MTWKGRWPGTWAVNCDVCGFRFPSDQLKRRWDGAMVCVKDWETRHPQTLIKVRGETAVPQYTRHNPTAFIPYCDIITSSGFADMGTADCMQADKDFPSYSDLLDIIGNGHGPLVPPPTPPVIGAPTVTSVLPNSGSTVGGDTITINGTNFVDVTNVKFGSTIATHTVNNSTKITATAPSGSGVVHITVTTVVGTSATTILDQYTYNVPGLCTVATRTAYADVGTADCMQADNNSPPYPP